MERRPAETFPPGEFLKDELEAREWTQSDLAEILDRPPRVVSEIVSGKRAISPDTARGLGQAFGMSAQFWLNLESAYQLARSEGSDPEDKAVSRRAKLYDKFPVRELVRRKWITASKDLEVLERNLIDFYDLKSMDENPHLPHAARRSNNGKLSPNQLAWLFRANELAQTLKVENFSEERIDETFGRLRKLLRHPEGIEQVPCILSDGGVRLLVIEPFPGSKIDGACFWLNKRSPVVVLALRYDRIDYFWYTLMHELEHVRRKHGQGEQHVDTNLVGSEALKTDDKPAQEKEADEGAQEFLICQRELKDFISRTQPYYSRRRISAFADRLEVHPALVVGQLQRRGEIPYSHSRQFLVKVRQIITKTALTDGWGTIPQVNRR